MIGTHIIWQDLIAPNWSNPQSWQFLALETRSFLYRFAQYADDDTKSMINETLAAWNASTAQRDHTRAQCKQRSAAVFQLNLEQGIWRRLAVQQGLLPTTDINYLTASPACIAALIEANANNTEWLKPPWTELRGQMRAVGSDMPYPYVQYEKPGTRYEALFDSDPAFNDLRFSFLMTVCPPGFQDLEEVLYNYPDDQVEGVLQFCSDELSAVHQTQLSRHCPPGFLERAWPIYVEAMSADDDSFYLSCDELLLICELRRKNVIIFGRSGPDSQAHCVGSVTGHENSPLTLVTLLIDPFGRTRSHFERLKLCNQAASSIGEASMPDVASGPAAIPSQQPIEQNNTVSISTLQEALQEYQIEGNLNLYQAGPANHQSDFLKVVDDYVQQLNSLCSVSPAQNLCKILKVHRELQQFISRLSHIEDAMEGAHDETQQRTPSPPSPATFPVLPNRKRIARQIHNTTTKEHTNKKRFCGAYSSSCGLPVPRSSPTALGSLAAESNGDEVPSMSAARSDASGDLLRTSSMAAGISKDPWMKTFSVQVSSTIEGSALPEHQLLEDAAQRVAKELIREKPTLPADPSNTEKSLLPDQIFGELPIIHCAFRRCTWHVNFTELPKDAGQEMNNAEVEASFRDCADHPCDVLLRQHIISQHSDQIAK